MTVIAWDGRFFVADKQYNGPDGHPGVVSKIFEVPDGLVAFTGDSFHAMALLSWFYQGRPQGMWPSSMTEESAEAVVITRDLKVLEYSGTGGPYPQINEAPFTAYGAGKPYALAAMYLGFGAIVAVQTASVLDINCGQGYDVWDTKIWTT